MPIQKIIFLHLIVKSLLQLRVILSMDIGW